MSAVVALLGQGVHALDFKANSVLSSGKWVKVKVGAAGVYELSYQRLKEFGFDSPEKVKVFGQGGNMATENFTVGFTDDLEQVPSLRENDKIYFYAKSTVRDVISIYNTAEFYLYNQIQRNAYSDESCYFLTDREDVETIPVSVKDTSEAQLAAASGWSESGTDFWVHEIEMTNLALSGKQFLGEDFALSGSISLDMQLPALAGGTIGVFAASGVKTAENVKAELSVNGKEVEYKIGPNFTANANSEGVVFGMCRLYGILPSSEAGITGEKASVSLSFSPANLQIGRLDYITVSYPAYHVIPADSAQARRYCKLASAEEGILLKNATPTTHAWLVDEKSALPDKNYQIVDYRIVPDGNGNGRFLPQKVAPWAEFVYFDTSKRQLEPEFVQNVANQNIHAEATPDMLIITTADLREEAERLADYHRDYDGMDVLVLDHNDIFNEFSSGCRDAMAYRRVAKMLNDRNPQKFGYLLLFGGGTYDNRRLLCGKDTDMLLTFQSTESSHEVNSFSTDDFFGVFSETATSLETAALNVPVGRIQYLSKSDMKKYVDKLIAYMKRKDAGNSAWRNNVLLIGEDGDDYIHVRQCETFRTKFEEAGNYDLNFNKIYMEAFTDEFVARKKFVDYLNTGQNAVLFVGHSNIASMTQSAVMMDVRKAIETKYAVPPIMYFSSCDVGRYDIGQTTFIDELMKNGQGGIIAAVASTRQAYTNLNGRMTDSFGKYLGYSDDDYNGGMTLGKVLMHAKNNCNDYTKNRLKYHLLGDPAMRVKMPLSRVVLTELDGNPIGESVAVAPLQKILVKGQVNASDGMLDADFQGSVRITLYDSEQNYMKTVNGSVTTQITDRGAELSYAGAEVVDGVFVAEIVIPEYANPANGVMPLRMVAESADGVTVCSGKCGALTFASKEGADEADDVAPVIEAMYIGRKEQFRDGAAVSPDFELVAEVSDNNGLNLSKETVSTSAYLSVDGGERTYPVSSFSVSGKRCRMVVPVYGMASGRHTAELVAADIAGNVASRTVSFFVEAAAEGMEIVMEEAAVAEQATFTVEPQPAAGNCEVVVTDDRGNTVFRADSVVFPFEWDGIGNSGERVAPGVYNLTGIVGGVSTPVKKIVVAEQ